MQSNKWWRNLIILIPIIVFLSVTVYSVYAAETPVNCARCHGTNPNRLEKPSLTLCDRCHVGAPTRPEDAHLYHIVPTVDNAECQSCHAVQTCTLCHTQPHNPPTSTDCQSCHGNPATFVHTPIGNVHNATGIKCNTCHDTHKTALKVIPEAAVATPTPVEQPPAEPIECDQDYYYYKSLPYPKECTKGSNGHTGNNITAPLEENVKTPIAPPQGLASTLLSSTSFFTQPISSLFSIAVSSGIESGTIINLMFFGAISIAMGAVLLRQLIKGGVDND